MEERGDLYANPNYAIYDLCYSTFLSISALTYITEMVTVDTSKVVFKN